MIRWWIALITLIAGGTAGVLIYAILTSGTVVDLQSARDRTERELERAQTANSDLVRLLDESSERNSELEARIAKLRKFADADKQLIGKLQADSESLATELENAYRISSAIRDGTAGGESAIAGAITAARRIRELVDELDPRLRK
jgi:predicted RNase H-like nuclease (RuvC/YqgF family)